MEEGDYVNSFKDVACNEQNKNWEQLKKRETALYSRDGDIRSEFQRDYTRILHSQGYRRLKHKTQVFFNIENDHICTRMEHVAHVESVAVTIAQSLGLNVDLVRAIALGHDIGHAPFGHRGEEVISAISEKYLHKKFWHERNGLRFVDDIELLPDSRDYRKNLNLTYAVRDGIISHCGEIDCNHESPREELFDLDQFTEPGQYSAATWEGCVVKVADKIAYVGRDIEDAICLGFIDSAGQEKLRRIADSYEQDAINTTVIMSKMILDICQNSSPEKGICLSEDGFRQLKEVKEFNYKMIYKNKRLKPFMDFSELVLNSILSLIFGCKNRNIRLFFCRIFRLSFRMRFNRTDCRLFRNCPSDFRQMHHRFFFIVSDKKELRDFKHRKQKNYAENNNKNSVKHSTHSSFLPR